MIVRAHRSTRWFWSPLTFVSLFSLLLLVSGCGGAHFNTTTSSAVAPTVSIAASPNSITVGGASMLSVAATHATAVTVTGTDGSSYTMPGMGGSQKVSPLATTTYTASASGTGGSVTSIVSITVTAAAPPATPAPTVTLAASPSSITAGSSATLTVVATNASAVTLSGSDGSTYTLPASGGSQAVTPKATTTYTAGATGSGGKASAVVTVMVAAVVPNAPTVAIAASPTSIVAGGTATLTVTAANAITVIIAGSDGSSYSLSAAGGTQAVTPAATTTYTATASSGAGNATATITVTVATSVPPIPPAALAPTVILVATPASITAGAGSSLMVAATNATTVTVAGSDGTSYTLLASGGTQPVTPAQTTTYTATATGAGGVASATATVTVVAPPTPVVMPTVILAANPSSITAGSSSTLTVAATNATTVTVTGTDGSTNSLAAAGGSLVVSPAGSTTYTATATNSGGSVTATAIVTVVAAAPPPPIQAPTVTLAGAPASISAGGSSTLTVVATNATAVNVTGTDGSTNSLATFGGSLVVSPATSTTYTATAVGAGGTATVMATVTVTAAVPPPPVLAPTVTITANPTSITTGSSSTLTIVASNALTVTVNGSDGSGFNLLATGGTQAVTPATTTTYTVTASSATATATQVVTVTVVAPPMLPTVTIAASPASIAPGGSSTLTVAVTGATTVVLTGSDSSSYTLPAAGGTEVVTPASTTSYTVAAAGAGGNATAFTTVTVQAAGSVKSINHVILMLQENHTFDNYFGMLNPYREMMSFTTGDDGNVYQVDGIDDKKISNENDEGVSFPLFKFRSTCIDDDSSEWLASYGDVNRYDFLTSRPIQSNGFVHNAEGFAVNCANTMLCNGDFSDVAGKRAMGYYDGDYLNYYYFMASQFALSDRWFSPLASKSTPNRIATFSGGTTQGLVLDPGYNDHLGGIVAPPIFAVLDKANVSWKVYYTQTAANCLTGDECGGDGVGAEPATDMGYLFYDDKYLYKNTTKAPCTGTTQPSSVVGDPTNSFCIDTNHIAPLVPQYYTDVANGTLPSFSFIESGSINDEHPGSGQSVLYGQSEMAKILNAFMTSPSWSDSAFFFSYDEGGGPYDHVPPVPGHSNDFTDKSMLPIPDIASIAVNPDNYFPCVPSTSPATQHCDLHANDPGTHPGDAATVHGFAAQIGFRVPNFVISPFTRRHYVSHIPMDHTAVIKFVEDRFIGNGVYLTKRDAAQPNLLDFFDFNAVPWATPPTPPEPVTAQTLGFNPCTPQNMGP